MSSEKEGQENREIREGETEMSSEKEGQDTPTKTVRKLSCTETFDALWFCYTPVHQLRQYYRLGYLDNCSQKWGALVDCLILKTKRSSEQQMILEARENAKTHIWTTRTPEEASAHWRKYYGHLDEVE